MHINEVKTLLNNHRETILAYETRNERAEYLICLFEQAYPDVPWSVAASDVTLMIAKQNHEDAQNLIQALRYLQTAKGEIVVIPGDIEDNTNEVMKYIQRFIAV